MADGTLIFCSFCGLSNEGDRKFIAGKNVYICDSCVALCNGMLGNTFAPPPVASNARKPLTRHQHGVYAFVAKYIEANGFAPSFAEIAANFGYRSLATVHEHLGNIERKGWITRYYNESRAIELRGVA